MHDLLRQEVAATADLVVVKVGTRVLTGDDGLLNRARVTSLAEELHQVMAGGRRVALVSSGAVGSGMGQLGLKKRPADLAHLQAVAAVGQAHLVQAYDQALRQHGRHAAQLLLTADDLDHRTRYLNVRNTILALMDLGAVPIINENDTVAVDELLTTFGDNDRLAAMVTNLLRAPLLVLLSDVDGLYDGHPRDPASKVVHTVTSLDASVTGLVREMGPGMGKGGMASKLEAARLVTTAGENCVIAGGRTPGNLARILAGEIVGTLFVPQGGTVSSRKRWIGFTAQPRGKLTLDAGAQRAVVEQGRSLLAIGIAAVEGKFVKGDVVSLCDGSGTEFARGLTNYNAADVEKIKGLKRDAIAAALSHCPYDEVIHRDNMVLTGG
ncbi:MAG: glutamate 5-kinase [Planctomycetia bacterium]|nr:glutamate 5-kinase [Planctomycetia bacterium]